MYRNVLVGWALLIPTEYTLLRIIFAMLLCIASLTLLLSVFPYQRPEDNLLAAGCQLVLLYGFIGAPITRRPTA